MRPTLLIPAAGRSQRFADQGHPGPKALLDIRIGTRTRTILQMILEEVPSEWAVLIVTRMEWLEQFQAAALRYHGEGVRVLGLEHETLGQSDTILRGLYHCEDDPVVVQNCDMWVARSALARLLTAAADTGAAVGLHLDARPPEAPAIYSYVDDPDQPTAFAEKRRISDWAMTGMWAAQRPGDLIQALQMQLLSGQREPNGEFYLSGAMPWMWVGEWSGVRLSPQEWLDLGTPSAVTAAGGEIL